MKTPWCELLRRTFEADALKRLVCGDRMALRALVPEDLVTAVLEAAAEKVLRPDVEERPRVVG